MNKPSKTKAPAGKSKTPDAKGLDRRKFFMMGGSAVAATAIVPMATEAEAEESQAERVKARYKADSADVRNYYRVNRY
jgi:hypothetical protein